MTEQANDVRPPEAPVFLEWARENLFRTWYDGLLTLASLAVLYFVITGLFRWVFFTADWTPVTKNVLLYLVGQYPRPELWRVGLSTGMVSLLLGLSWGRWPLTMRPFAVALAGFYVILAMIPGTLSSGVRLFLVGCAVLIVAGYFFGRGRWLGSRLILGGWVVSLVATMLLLRGWAGLPGLGRVEINLWGGLIVTALLAVGGILISFPFGVLLALGRRSSLPVVSAFSTGFIELIRGVPLISILFLFSLIVPLFLPSNMRFDRMLRALVAMVVFSAAYTAENVRGGLQAIPPGQYEAAHALGLRNTHTTLLIVLPQALRKVIPTIVGQFISLFKDTTLASGVAVLELLSIGRSILQGNPEYIGRQAEVYFFIAAIFWVFSYSMSVASRQIEARLGVGQS
ncbi:MAG: ABC transporter permease subunit [Anaerolineales bacterium]